MKFKNLIILNILLFFSFSSCSASNVKEIMSEEKDDNVTDFVMPDHPRLLLMKDEEIELKRTISSDIYWRKIHNEIITVCDELQGTPVLKYEKEGRRLLEVSRKALRNIFFLSYGYRVTGNDTYAKRAEMELLAVSNFPDWNPSHFLDVGEMALGVAIGYDWLHDCLSADSKIIIRNALLEKGIKPSKDKQYNSFLTMESNWSQVCNAGMLYAALAIAEDYPELSKEIIDRSIKHFYMGVYAPDGAYAEGVGYWSYGTSFTALFISALEKIYNDDFGLSQALGFKQTAEYAQSMIAPDGAIYNYSDSNEFGKTGLNTSLFWFASKYNDPSLLWMQKEELAKINLGQKNNRILPALLIWSKKLRVSAITAPENMMYTAQGKSPVALMRTSWEDKENAIFLGYKLGSPSVSHAHMDIGSFVFVANGVRWASDIGMQEYESLESLGMQIWDYKQNSERWDVFRFNSKSHNTLTIDGALQNVKGSAKLDKTLDSKTLKYAISDLSTIYQNQVKEVKRGVAIVENKFAVIRDEIATLDKQTNIRWNMLTYCNVESTSGKEAVLNKDGKRIILRIDSPHNAVFTTLSATKPNSWDAENKNATLIGLDCDINEEENITIQVSLIPDYINQDKYFFNKQLINW